MSQWHGMRTMIAYTMVTAVRDRLLLALVVLIGVAAAVSVFIGGTAVVEQRELTAAYVATATRFILITGLVLFVSFHVRRSLDSREVELIVSRPLSRANFFVAYAASFVIVAAFAVVIATVAVGVAAQPSVTALGLWAFTLFIESTIIVVAALFFALSLRSAVAGTLATLAFYVLARMIGMLSAIAQTSGDKSLLLKLSAMIFEGISLFIPRLDLLGQTRWLVYGLDGEIHLMAMVAQGLIYVPLLLAIGVFDFQRRRF